MSEKYEESFSDIIGILDDQAGIRGVGMIKEKNVKPTLDGFSRTNQGGKYYTQQDNSGAKSFDINRIIYFDMETDDDVLFSSGPDPFIVNPRCLIDLGIAVVIGGTVSCMKRTTRQKGIITKCPSGYWVSSYTNNPYTGNEISAYETFSNGVFYRGYRDLAIMRACDTKKNHENDNETAYLTLSAIENAACMWSIEITDGEKSAIVPTSFQDIKGICMLRDVDEGKRRKSILHFVKNHKRTVADKKIAVGSFFRGIEKINIGDFDVIINPPISQISETDTKKAINCFSRDVYNMWKEVK